MTAMHAPVAKRRQILGCILGGALGDPWGGPWEGRAEELSTPRVFQRIVNASENQMSLVTESVTAIRPLMLLMTKSDTGSPPCRPSRHRRRPCYTPQSPGHPQQQWKTGGPVSASHAGKVYRRRFVS